MEIEYWSNKMRQERFSSRTFQKFFCGQKQKTEQLIKKHISQSTDRLGGETQDINKAAQSWVASPPERSAFAFALWSEETKCDWPHRAGHSWGVSPTWQQSGTSVLTGCWKASPCYLIHFTSPLGPSSLLFICPSLCSVAASEVSHTQSSIPGPSSRAVWVCVTERVRVTEREGSREEESPQRLTRPTQWPNHSYPLFSAALISCGLKTPSMTFFEYSQAWPPCSHKNWWKWAKRKTETKPVGRERVFRRGFCTLNPNTKVTYMNLNI